MRYLTIFILIFGSVTITSCGQSPSVEEGTWQITQIEVNAPDTSFTITDLGVGRLIFHAGQYSQVWMQSNRVLGASPSDKAEAYDSFDASAGSYTFSGETLTLTPLISRDPNMVGHSTATTVSFDGDTMTRKGERPNPSDPMQTLTWISTYTRVR